MTDEATIRRPDAAEWTALLRAAAKPASSAATERICGDIEKAVGEALSTIVGIETRARFSIGAPAVRATGSRHYIVSAWAAEDGRTPRKACMTLADARALTDIACGGEPENFRSSEDAPLGRIERALALALIDALATAVRAPLTPAGDPTPLVRTSAEVEESQALPGTDFNACIEALAGPLAASCILEFPAAVIADFAPGAASAPHRQSVASWRDAREKLVDATEVSLVASIVESGLTVGDIHRLAPGETLRLTTTPRSDIELSVYGEAVFRCRLGQEGGAYTVRVAGHDVELRT